MGITVSGSLHREARAMHRPAFRRVRRLTFLLRLLDVLQHGIFLISTMLVAYNFA